MASRLRIQKDLELSATPGSIITTSAGNEAQYTAPGTNGQVLTVVSGVPTWAAAPTNVLTTLGYNPTTGVLTYVDEAGATTSLNLPLEKFLASASLDTTTNILTLTLNDASTVTVNMTDYLGYTFNVADGSANTQTISVSDTLTFLATNGFTTTVSATDTVTFTPPTGTVNGQIMTWNNTTQVWAAATPASQAFTAVADSGTGQIISAGNNLNILGSRGFTTVASATDIITVTPPAGTATGQVMTWNNTTSVWEPTTPATGSTFTVAGNAGTNQTISAGDTLTITGASNGIIATGTATDTITLALRETSEFTDGLTSGTTYIAAQNPIASTLRVYRNGLKKIVGDDYTLAGNVVTFVVPFGVSGGASGGETVELDYRY